MKVLVDVQALSVPAAVGRGAGTASKALTNALLRHAPDFEIFLLRGTDGEKWQIGRVPAGVHHVDSVWNDHRLWVSCDPAVFMRDAKIDLYYVTCPLIFGFHVPPTPPGVLVASQVHDMVPVVMADQYLNTWPADLQTDYRRQLQFLQSADLLLGSSQSTADDLIAHLKPRGNVQVAYLCTVKDFRPIARRVARRLVEQHLGLNRPYVLSITENDPRKNTHGLIAGFAAAQLPEHQLVVAGMFADPSRQAVKRIAEQQGITNQVVTLGFVPHLLLNALYCAAELLLFPSLYEGFGLPALEAMQAGVPVVAGDNSCFPEVVGEGGLLVDASRHQRLGATIRRVAIDSALRKELVVRGFRQADRFSYERTAEAIKSAFTEIVK